MRSDAEPVTPVEGKEDRRSNVPIWDATKHIDPA
jgi:hypothetical protein